MCAELPLPLRPTGIMFHHFHGDGYPVSQGSISADDLDRMLTAVGVDRILPATEWVDRTEQGTLRPGDLCLTFDDNLLCQYKIALPVLQSHGLTAFWFVYTSVNQGVPERLEIYRHFRTVGFRNVDSFYSAFHEFVASRPEGEEVAAKVKAFDADAYLPDYIYLSRADKVFRYVRDRVLGRERYERTMDAMIEHYGFETAELADFLWMKDELLRELHAGEHVIGLHSHTHPTLIEGLPVVEQKREYETNFDHLHRLLATKPRTASHPNNSYSDQTLDVLRNLNITVCFRANMTKPTNAPLELPRHNHALIHRSVRAHQEN